MSSGAETSSNSKEIVFVYLLRDFDRMRTSGTYDSSSREVKFAS